MADLSGSNRAEALGPSPYLPSWEPASVSSGFYASSSSTSTTSNKSGDYVEDVDPRFLETENPAKLPALHRSSSVPSFLHRRTPTAIYRGVESSVMATNNNSNMFPQFPDNSSNASNSFSGLQRQAPSPISQHQGNQVNGNGVGGMNVSMPMHAGQQMDMNYLYNLVCEYSEVLKYNREQTAGIVKAAEEVMRRATEEGASPSVQHVDREISAGRIAELERALAKERRLTELLKREQVENTKLIGEYETAVGTMVEQIRNYCQNNNMVFLSQKRYYNNLLQQERDEHLASRLEKDHWHAETMKVSEMIRTAYKLRCEEEDVPYRVICGLQNEVRALRNAVGMEAEKPEEETGWEILKDAPVRDPMREASQEIN